MLSLEKYVMLVRVPRVEYHWYIMYPGAKKTLIVRLLFQNSQSATPLPSINQTHVDAVICMHPGALM